MGCYQFRVTRNSDLFVDEEEVKNLRTALQGELLHRHFGDAVRLEVADNCSQRMVRLPAAAVRPAARPTSTASTARSTSTACARCPTRSTARRSSTRRSSPGCRRALDSGDLFEVLKKQDVLLHHPFQSFLPVIDFIRTTAERPERHRDQADRLPHRHRLGADGDPDRRRAQGQGSHGGGRADGALRRGSEHQLGGAAGGGRRAGGLRRGRPQDARQDGAGRAPRGDAKARCCAATRTSAPATTTRHRARSTPTSACSPRTRSICADVNEVFLQLTGLGARRAS